MFKAKYSGSARSGVCKCGHSWEKHHLGIVMNNQYIEETKEGYIPQECEVGGFNETGGMIFNEQTGEWKDHCFGYVDSLDKEDS